jgi:D-alanyl-D-alanine carboxypeptidase
VPTAIPGRSLHELGLAVDITAGGSSLTAGSPGFRWLAANAATYGYVNLPSEPWHWSITGG